MTEEILKDRNLSRTKNPIEWDQSNPDSQYSLVFEDSLISAKIAKKFYKKNIFKRYFGKK